MQTPQAALDFYSHEQQIAAATVMASMKLWRRMGTDFDQSWSRVGPKVAEVVAVGRAASAASAVQYTPSLLAETNQDAPAYGTVNTKKFLSSAPDGRSMDSLLDETVIRSKVAVASGLAASEALEVGERWLSGTLLTVMADTRRSVVGADIAQRPSIAGYTRMLNAPSCSRCVILAGKWFRWNQGFQRHPRCDCIHVPSVTEAFAREEGFVSDPYEYFNSLSKEQQEKVFGRIEARAIRDGGDIFRVENTRLRGLGTAKGNLRYGTPSKMTVDDIYRTAGTRANAIRMMEREGFITGPQVSGGNVLGVREGFGALGKGGKAKAASDAVNAARATGKRDPLNRYTMTAAERRLYDAKYRLDVGKTGVWPQSVGQNSADRYSRPRAITAGELALLERTYKAEIAKLKNAPDSVRKLAQLLGI